MSTLSQVRSIISDKAVPRSEVVTFDGILKRYRVKNFPIDATTVVTTPVIAAPTINAETGLLTWAVAPDAADVTIEYDSYFLSDDTINDLIAVNTDDEDGTFEVRYIAADALDSLATNQALLLKVIKDLDIQTDGAALAKALRAHAESLRQFVKDDPSWDFAQQINDIPGLSEKYLKDILRNNG